MKGRGQLLYLFATGLLLELTTTVTAIPLNEFYPYGVEAGDSLANRTLDGSSPIILPLEFPFFGRSFSTIFVSQSDYALLWRHMEMDRVVYVLITKLYPIYTYYINRTTRASNVTGLQYRV